MLYIHGGAYFHNFNALHWSAIAQWAETTGCGIDTFLNAEVLRHIGADWADNLDTHNPMVSPLYGDMHNLPPTDLYTGTWEVFFEVYYRYSTSPSYQSPDLSVIQAGTFCIYMEWQLCHEVHDMAG